MKLTNQSYAPKWEQEEGKRIEKKKLKLIKLHQNLSNVSKDVGCEKYLVTFSNVVLNKN
jgi:hypothetical protein